jgi:hypothetical protein
LTRRVRRILPCAQTIRRIKIINLSPREKFAARKKNEDGQSNNTRNPYKRIPESQMFSQIENVAIVEKRREMFLGQRLPYIKNAPLPIFFLGGPHYSLV